MPRKYYSQLDVKHLTRSGVNNVKVLYILFQARLQWGPGTDSFVTVQQIRGSIGNKVSYRAIKKAIHSMNNQLDTKFYYDDYTHGPIIEKDGGDTIYYRISEALYVAISKSEAINAPSKS